MDCDHIKRKLRKRIWIVWTGCGLLPLDLIIVKVIRVKKLFISFYLYPLQIFSNLSDRLTVPDSRLCGSAQELLILALRGGSREQGQSSSTRTCLRSRDGFAEGRPAGRHRRSAARNFCTGCSTISSRRLDLGKHTAVRSTGRASTGIGRLSEKEEGCFS